MEKPRKKTKIDHNSSLDTNANNTDLISTDIVNEILQKLPAKSVASFVRVSKSWATIIRSNYFINSFSLQRSMKFQFQQDPHRLLLAFNDKSDENHWIFSSFSSTLAIEKPPLEFISRMVSQFNSQIEPPIYVNGLLSFTCGISNPSTGKSIVLPIIKSRRKILKRYFGFDPINSEYKVLCIIDPKLVRGNRIQNQVLTVETKSLWREIDLWIPHHPVSTGICIDGIIYYLAYETTNFMQTILVRFDVRSEKFLKELPCLFLLTYQLFGANLINYESKLAIIHQTSYNSIVFWVLEDVEKLEWSKINHDVTPWRSFISSYEIRVLGTTRSGETVYTSYGNDGNFFIIYHDLKKNECRRRVDIEPYYRSFNRKFKSIIGFIDYVESVMLL